MAQQGDFESARGALLVCMSLGDPEWSPRAAAMLGEMLWERGDADAAEPVLRVAVDFGHEEWSAAAGVTLGVVLAHRGDIDAEQAYRAVIATGHVDHGPNAWFNLGALHQERGDFDDAVAAYRVALASGHADIAPKAAVNLGFVLFTELDDSAGAEEAFTAAVASGDPVQAELAAANLAAMRQFTSDEDRSGELAIDDPTSVATGVPTRFKWRLWNRRDRA